MGEHHSCCSVSPSSSIPFYRNFLFWILVLLGVLILGSLVFPSLQLFRFAFFNYANMMFIPVALGLVLGGIVDHYIPQEYISKHLAGSKKRSVFYAAGLGFLMSSCNHGIVALSMELHRKGASGPAVLSFLLASPWANLPITILLMSFFGWKGVLIIILALILSITSGLIFRILDQKGWIESNPHTVKTEMGFSMRQDIRRRWKQRQWTKEQWSRDLKGIYQGARSLSGMVLSWVILGVILASLSQAFVPAHFFQKYLGATFMGLTLTLLVSAVLEVCSEGTSPLAFEIYKQTGALGNAFAFLMGGVITDYTEIGLIWKHLGPRTALWMILVNLPQVILTGWILNQIFS